jgi:hypothetical protein
MGESVRYPAGGGPGPLRWLHEPCDGYGYLIAVPCRVVREGNGRVQIAALRNDGTEVLRRVAYESLRAPAA